MKVIATVSAQEAFMREIAKSVGIRRLVKTGQTTVRKEMVYVGVTLKRNGTLAQVAERLADEGTAHGFAAVFDIGRGKQACIMHFSPIDGNRGSDNRLTVLFDFSTYTFQVSPLE